MLQIFIYNKKVRCDGHFKHFKISVIYVASRQQRDVLRSSAILMIFVLSHPYHLHNDIIEVAIT